jgi:Na+:H+ antiporter, NhaA family
MIRLLHPWSAYLVLPIFALAKAGVPLSADFTREALSSRVVYGIAGGLIIVKPVGIIAFAYVAWPLHIVSLIEGIGWRHMLGVGVLGGIGFTVSLFMTDLAFQDPALISSDQQSKIRRARVAGIAGFVSLRQLQPSKQRAGHYNVRLRTLVPEDARSLSCYSEGCPAIHTSMLVISEEEAA